MRILFITTSLSVLEGGPFTYLLNLSNYLSNSGHKVSIFTLNKNYDPAVAKLFPNIKIRTFAYMKGRIFFSPIMKRVLTSEIKNFDIVHLNNYWGYQNIIASNLANKHHIPYVITLHGTLPIMMSSRIFKTCFHLFFGRKILRNAAKVIAVSPFEVDQIKSRKVDYNNIIFIPLVVLPQKNHKDKMGIFRQRFKIDAKEKIVLFLARIHPIKGLEILLRAFAILAKENSNVRLVVAGPDEGYLDEAKKLIEDLDIYSKVIFTGYLDGEDKHQAYLESDVFVLPSKYEIFGTTVLEAWDCRIPVIITDRNGIAAIVAENEAGAVIPYDSEALSEALKNLLSDNKLRMRYIQQGSKVLQEKFSFNKVMEQYEKMYKEALS
ncbi:MAG: glycosyltransferase [Candidatus Saganbacteria bacterium]|nr:glycosyltransferase [Candidatus Saganbacteria bacterium]